MKKILFFLVLIVWFITSCNEEGVKVENSVSNVAEYEENCYTLSDLEIQTLGELHNKLIIDHYYRVDSIVNMNGCGLCLDQFTSYFNSADLDIDFDLLGITQEQFVQNASEVIIECEQFGWSLANYSNPYVSSEVIEILSRIDQAFQQSTYADETEMVLLDLKDEVSQTFRCSEYNLLMGTLEIAIYSNCIWGPSRTYVKNNTHSQRDSFGWDWNGAAAGDTAASASYFMRLGVAGAVFGSTPGTNGVILGGWGIAAGLGSLWGGVKNLGGSGGDGDPPHTKQSCP